MDKQTGRMSAAHFNDPFGRQPGSLSQPIADRLNGPLPEYKRTKGAGSHSEIFAADELLKARPGSRLEDFAVWSMEIQMKGNYAPKFPDRFLHFKRPCPHCGPLLRGVEFVE